MLCEVDRVEAEPFREFHLIQEISIDFQLRLPAHLLGDLEQSKTHLVFSPGRTYAPSFSCAPS
jgi:hypothetical protein